MEQIKIQGIDYDLCVQDNLIRDFNAQAEINYVQKKIRVDSAIYATDRGYIAIMHEIIHGVLEGLCFEDENNNEHLVQCLAVSLYQIFKEEIEKCIGQKLQKNLENIKEK